MEPIMLSSVNINRSGEDGNIPARTDRFFSVQGAWYFATREGAPLGPFDNKQEAERGLDDFIEFLSLAEPGTLSKLYASLSTG